ncbi:MAG: hypothetical protein Q9218_006572, partial [Villophora microphyllina]
IVPPSSSSTTSSKLHSPSSLTGTINDLPTLLTALMTLTTTLTAGGSFLLSRCETLLPPLTTLSSPLQNLYLQEVKTLGPVRAQRGLKFKCWDALAGFVVTMVQYVGITREMEEGVFEVLGEALEKGDKKRMDEVRKCLEGVNPGALWLLEEGRRDKEGEEKRDWEKPVVEGWEFGDVEFY